MRNPAVAKAYADIAAAAAVLTGVVNQRGSGGLSAEGDPSRELSEDCLDILAAAAAADAQMAGVKAQAAVTYADIAQATAPPEASVQAQEMAVTAEVACALTIGDRAAGSFLAVSHALTTTLPLTLAALQSGTISWQHARVMADEAATLDRAGAAALEAHFLDPDAPDAVRGCPAGEMPASRFRHQARTWRERHHTESIEKRHAERCPGPAGRIHPGPGRNGLALGLPASGPGGRNLEPDHRHRPRAAGPL